MIAWLAGWGVLAALAGWLTGTGFVRAFTADACGAEQRCGALGTAGYLTGGILLWLVAMVAAGTLGQGDDLLGPTVVAGRAVLPGSVALALLGAALSAGQFRIWPALLALPPALLARWGERWGARRWRTQTREKLRRVAETEQLESRGVTVAGVITDIRHTGSTYNDCPELALTVGYRPAGGDDTLTASHTDAWPVHRLPRQGGRADVTYDPQDPAVYRVEVPVGVEALAPPRQPADDGHDDGHDGGRDRDRLADELERLAALHRAGDLDDGEFALAKARLLRPATGTRGPELPA